MLTSTNLRTRLQHTRKGKSKGFTLIELMVVIAIIAVIAAEFVPELLDSGVSKKVADGKKEVVHIARAVQKTYSQDGEYPATIDFDDIDHHLPSNIDVKNPWDIDYAITGGGITYGSGCTTKTARPTDLTIFKIALILPTNSDDAVLRVKDDYDDCTAQVTGTTIFFEFE
ncbi:prepilin-type N-terminal cleavage/methylation domain-containing protein [Vibrio parahaemolyticus]|jgi:prepilin-type N-terminal cleavage/methylation domain-containing protein|uniref:prepilin-type N-terminal cleavage/methylation domain-containing protein n=1 Tax=Vibrio parahaemolyticus TaxID=670 RepID=UPI0015D2A1C0|nr:prepilin-type N-terminal cleavage/methylation domain-containing protein [Vibrio parahaemolyticus]MBE4385026.1 prepilin-type N-terminal cleavage/methylation domain-containing protein [Vibrio parahaemolyticus]MBO0179855.1 prepilin-type N-terminal cleavage/methylation domain-containing protein [Vibrio parahaemolyticus]MDF5359922.1 prepilin-type N-terminal cleavage/methylation domain-containing protein [Vibrio parahaemolyticus]MDG2754393.1 prepilin-type N-terminal cleavage/methylation domain-con